MACWIQREPVGSPNGVCFHCQQCAEKYLKAQLTEKGAGFTRSHDLDVPFDLATQALIQIESLRHDLKFLNPFSVETRYPGVSADPSDAIEALRITILYREQVRPMLGISD